MCRRPDYKRHLYIHLGRGWVYCPRCGYSESLWAMAKRHDGTSLQIDKGVRGSKTRQRWGGTPFTTPHDERAVDVLQIPEFRLLLEDTGRQAVYFTEYLLGRGFTLQQIQRRQIGWSIDPALAGRLIFPCIMGGNIVYYSARAMVAGLRPKYITAPGRPPAGMMYNIDEALCYRHIYIVEGPLDVLDDWYVAVLGSSLTQDMAETVKQNWDKASIIFDGDAHSKAVNAAQLLLKLGVEVQLLLLEEGEDPNSIGSGEVEEELSRCPWSTPLSLLENTMKCIDLHRHRHGKRLTLG